MKDDLDAAVSKIASELGLGVTGQYPHGALGPPAGRDDERAHSSR